MHGPGDEAALIHLAGEESALTGEAPSAPLTPEQARAYLAAPTVWHWHAEAGGEIVGFLMAYVHPRRHGAARDVMFEEIGVHEDWRRQGVGRALVAALHARMREEGIADVWVAADNPGA